jgi:type IV pilus assembly protein PilZ
MPQIKGVHNLNTNNFSLEEDNIENRKSHREPVNILADYSISGQFKNDLIKNLSEGGVFIETNEVLEVGEYIVLTYNNPNNNENVKIGGVVVRKEQRGVGVKFNIGSKIDKEKTQKRKEQVEDVCFRKVKRSKGVPIYFFTRPKVRKQFNSTYKKTTQSVVILLFFLVLMLWGLHDLGVKMQTLNNGQEITGKIRTTGKVHELVSYNIPYENENNNFNTSYPGEGYRLNAQDPHGNLRLAE